MLPSSLTSIWPLSLATNSSLVAAQCIHLLSFLHLPHLRVCMIHSRLLACLSLYSSSSSAAAPPTKVLATLPHVAIPDHEAPAAAFLPLVAHDNRELGDPCPVDSNAPHLIASLSAAISVESQPESLVALYVATLLGLVSWLAFGVRLAPPHLALGCNLISLLSSPDHESTTLCRSLTLRDARFHNQSVRRTHHVGRQENPKHFCSSASLPSLVSFLLPIAHKIPLPKSQVHRVQPFKPTRHCTKGYVFFHFLNYASLLLLLLLLQLPK